MALVRSKRRRTRRLDPAVLRAIREAVMTGASAPAVRATLEAMRDREQLPTDVYLPSDRTISSIAREMQRDESGPWSPEDADPTTVQLLLQALHIVIVQTEGRVAGFTKREAQLLPVFHAAAHPRYSPWQAYLWTRWYLSWVRSAQDAQDVMLTLAALQESGRWPITRWPAIERVFASVSGWLPPEMLEVQQ